MEWNLLDWEDNATHPTLDAPVLVCCVGHYRTRYVVAKMHEAPRHGDRYFVDIDDDYWEWLSDRDQHFRVSWTPITNPVIG